MSLKRLHSPLHRRSLLQRGTRVTGRPGFGVVPALPARRPASREPLNEARREDFQREVQKAKDIALEMSWPLRRSEERLDSALHRIDSTLQELSAQRERIRRLEHDLGIER